MSSLKHLLAVLYILLMSTLFAASTVKAAIFDVRNNCPFTVWAAAVPAGGGRKLDRGEIWIINVNPGLTSARIWGRTGCKFNGAGHGRCQTGDCGGLLHCKGHGQPPNTLAEFALNQSNNSDVIAMSLVEGFNLPMDLSAISSGCNTRAGIRCMVDISRQCPAQLRVQGGCNNPCTVFKTDQYCCKSGNCGPTDYSRFFKTRCPDAYSYPKDDQANTYTCPGGTNYRVVFCPYI